MVRASIALVCLVAFTACAHDVDARYPVAGGAGGTVVVELTRAAPDLTVAIDGAIVVVRAHSRRVTVTGVPPGTSSVDIAFGGGEYARAEHHVTVDLQPGETRAIVLPGPERSIAAAIGQGALVIAEMAYLGLIYVALL
jgi:hypothetical protein